MLNADRNQRFPLQSLAALLLKILADSNLLSVIDKLLPHLLLLAPTSGMYEVLEHDVRLELLDTLGREAVYYKRQRVRFLQDNIVAYEDKAWGDGNIFAKYKCSPGVPVDYYRDGHRYRVLISLRETKKRGDVMEFHIQRQIECGFMQEIEELQSEIDHETKELTLTVIFPQERHPKAVWRVKQNAARTTPLESNHFQRLPDGKLQIRWRTQHPKRFDAYSLRWSW